MKTKHLIEQLQEADPTGELEVTVGKIDIHFLQVLPGYYDGCYEVLTRDLSREGYNIVGGEIRSDGRHVCIETLPLKTVLWDDPDAIIKLDKGAEEAYGEDIRKRIADARKYTDELEQEDKIQGSVK